MKIDPQAATNSQAKFASEFLSTEKIRLAEFAAKFCPPKINRKKYRYSNNKVKSTLQ